VADEAPEPSRSITATHDYGQITLTVDGPLPVGVSEEQVQEVLGSMRRRAQNQVVPAVEQIMEDEGVHISGETTHAEIDFPLHLPSSGPTAHIDCEMVAEVSSFSGDSVGRDLQKLQAARPRPDAA
jgi:hypothetical protein